MSDLIGSHDSRKISRVDNGNIFAFNLLENVEVDYEIIACQQKLNAFTASLKAAQQLQKDWIEHGLDAVYLYCDDVDGDWIETWGDDEHEQG